MWNVSGTTLVMAEGDYGIKLPVTISGATLSASDSLRFTFKNQMNGDIMLVKDFDNVQQSTVNLELTEAESALFPVGNYVYSLDWFQDGNFMCNIIPTASIKVVDKA